VYKKVFISHSKHDPNLSLFKEIFAMLPTESKWMELENVEPPPALSIRREINESDAVFVLLSENLVDLQHTSNWVSFEVGLASNRTPPEHAAMSASGRSGLDIWVFEPLEKTVRFPVPYLTHYMRYPLDQGAVKWLRDVLRDSDPRHLGMATECPYEDCKISFRYLSRLYTDDLWCPACRNYIRFHKSAKEVKEALQRMGAEVTEQVAKEIEAKFREAKN